MNCSWLRCDPDTNEINNKINLKMEKKKFYKSRNRQSTNLVVVVMSSILILISLISISNCVRVVYVDSAEEDVDTPTGQESSRGSRTFDYYGGGDDVNDGVHVMDGSAPSSIDTESLMSLTSSGHRNPPPGPRTRTSSSTVHFPSNRKFDTLSTVHWPSSVVGGNSGHSQYPGHFSPGSQHSPPPAASGDWLSDGVHVHESNDGNKRTKIYSGIDSIEWKPINFSSPHQELAQTRWWYDGPIAFSARGMDHLYLLNSWLLSLIQPPGLPEEVIKDQLFVDPLPLIKEHRSKLLAHFWGLILTATIALCLAIVVPMFGFMICCCWCSDSSATNRRKSRETSSGNNLGYHTSTSGGAQTRPKANNSGSKRRSRSASSRRYSVEGTCDSFFRSFFGILHFHVLLLITFFAISAFVTNEYIRNGLTEMPKTLNQSLDDVQLYLNNTQFEVNTLLRTNFGQLEAALSNSLDKSGSIVKDRLARVSEAIALDNLTEIVSKLDTIQADLRVLSQETNELRNSLHLLSTGLHRAKKDLEKVFKDCTHPVCTALRSKYRFVLEKFRVSTKLDDLPDLSPLMSNITALLQADIVHEVQRGKESFDRISGKIQSAVNDSIPEIKRQVRAIGFELSRNADEINEALKIPFKDISKGKEFISRTSEWTQKYELYRWYICLVASSIILIILILYTTGLLSGICGHQPTVNDYRNRGIKPPQTWTLSVGIFLTFFFFGVLLLANIGLFLIGGLTDRVACYYLEHPADEGTKSVVQLLQRQLLELPEKDSSESLRVIRSLKPNLAEIVIRCHQNQSLYRSLSLDQLGSRMQLSSSKVIEDVNISSLLQFKARYRIDERLGTFLNKVDVNPGPIVILTREANELLDKLKDTSLGTLNFTSFADLVNQRITPLDLISVANELESESNLLPPSQIEHSTNLKNIAIMLESYQLKVISKVHHSVERLRAGAGKIERKAQYGSKGLKEALTGLLNQAKNAQTFIENQGKAEIRKVAKQFIGDMSDLIDQYSNHVIAEVENNVGRCEPVSRAVNASVMAMCKEVVLPFNGYWLSMSSALLLCLPATLSAFILSRLYRKLKRGRTNRRHIDSDYALEALEEDDIPLAHLADKHETSRTSYAVEARRAGPSGLYLSGHSSHNHDRHGHGHASAPIGEDSWSPGAPPMYTRPPPYNFNN